MGIEYYVGIDIGSTCAKTVVMGAEEKILYRLLRPTGWSSVETASSIREELESLGISADRSIVVSTGYGRAAVPFAAKNETGKPGRTISQGNVSDSFQWAGRMPRK